MKCIFCKTEIVKANFSREHIVPKFLGGEKVIHNICKDCNSKFGGDFEKKLGENDVFNFVRAFYRLKSRNSSKYITPTIKFKQDTTSIGANEDGYLLMYTKPNFDYSDTTIEVDQKESQELVENMIKGKINSLKSDDNQEYEIIKNIKKLEIGEPEDFVLDVDIRVIGELFIKIAYEFACICLDSQYFDDEMAYFLKHMIISDVYDVFSKKINIKFSYDKQKLDFCVRRVCEVARDNTINFHYGSSLVNCSNGNYIHKISLIKRHDKFFVLIVLFDIFKCRICVSNDANNWDYEEGLISKLITGRCDGKLINKTDSPFTDILLRLRNTNLSK